MGVYVYCFYDINIIPIIVYILARFYFDDDNIDDNNVYTVSENSGLVQIRVARDGLLREKTVGKSHPKQNKLDIKKASIG